MTEHLEGSKQEWPPITIMREKAATGVHRRPSHHWSWWESGDYDDDRYETARYVPEVLVEGLVAMLGVQLGRASAHIQLWAHEEASPEETIGEVQVELDRMRRALASFKAGS